jgi:hypothetical protein
MPKAVTNIVPVSPYHNHSTGNLALNELVERERAGKGGAA